MSHSQEHSPKQALAIFVGHADCRWLKCLRVGFRHCFVALRDGDTWLLCDPLKDRIEMRVMPVSADFDLAGFYAGQGHIVLQGHTKPGLPRGLAAITPLTCVTVAKRLLGVRTPWVVTPWQLCRHLRSVMHRFADVRPGESPHQPARSVAELDRHR